MVHFCPMKKLFLLLLFSLTLACNKTDPKEQIESFNVGVIVPLSGELAGYGKAVVNGIKLAEIENPSLFTNINFYYQDSKYDSKVAVSAFRALNENNDINLYHTWGVSPNESLIPILEANKIPAIVETTLTESTLDKKFIIRAART